MNEKLPIPANDNLPRSSNEEETIVPETAVEHAEFISALATLETYLKSPGAERRTARALHEKAAAKFDRYAGKRDELFELFDFGLNDSPSRERLDLCSVRIEKMPR